MSTDRRRRRSVARSKNDHEQGAPPARVHLAPGVRLDGGSKHGTSILLARNGDVQLNDGAAAILRLCDGSRDRDNIVATIVRTSKMRTIAADVVEFLNVARARGWIVED